MISIHDPLSENSGTESGPKPNPKPQPVDTGMTDQLCVVGAQLC
jgi:hypothetical protein